MFPNSPYAKPVSSFQRPVPLVLIDPEAEPTLCVKFNQNWLAYIIGSLQQLLLQTTWKTSDPDELNTVQGRAWTLINQFSTALTCAQETARNNGGTSLEDSLSQQIRINPDDTCIIQMWCVDHWENWYDPRDCIASGSTQQPPQEGPGIGETVSACYPIQANARLLLPYPVKGGDVITTSGAAGGWSGGGLTWACPNGGVYGLGICGAPLATVGTDPMPGLPHMRVIGHLLTTDVYFDAFDTVFNVPTSYPEQSVEFLCNDDDLTDNAGSITLCVKTEANNGVVNLISITTAIINNRAILSQTAIHVGESFDFYLVAQSGVGSNPYDGKFIMDTPATLEITAVTNWTPGTGWQWFDPPTGAGGAPPVGASQNTTGFAGNATTPGIVTFRLVSIP